MCLCVPLCVCVCLCVCLCVPVCVPVCACVYLRVYAHGIVSTTSRSGIGRKGKYMWWNVGSSAMGPTAFPTFHFGMSGVSCFASSQSHKDLTCFVGLW